ncbi:S1 RNA-binding domain-containing protein [Lentzea sp. BCCO 10_0061]|uniref:S1 RNA-binding domain-containing protein n=1 Tax=Lentzea sokolovensis TaxID=3095429 RepID=A0ABU4V4N8_9PSEU|nr:S1 RNA-binding domain-containing protein [Lentzea sp. BCCO 10_0061]MDX8146767.1 S1 RNA-binding domain-containing protein [Lentzea sp. BCCO 10_0061]
MNPQEHPELDAFLSSLRRGDLLSGTVAAIESFGVFVRLDDGPVHPHFAGVGFVTAPELTWHRVEALSDAVRVGQRVTGEFLQYDTWNMEARLSLKALQPNPHLAIAAGQEFRGRVTKVVPFGVFVQIADGVEGLVPDPDLAQVGDAVDVVVTEVDRERHRIVLSGA